MNIFQRNSIILFSSFLEGQIRVLEDWSGVIRGDEANGRDAAGGIDLLSFDVGKQLRPIFDKFLMLKLDFVLVAPNLVETVHIKLD